MISQAKQKGFTIVELLIVIVVIAILAAISIVAYNGVTQRARDNERQSDARNIVNAVSAYNSEESKWLTTPQEVKSELAGYDTTKVPSEALDKVGGQVPDAQNKDRYQFETCSTNNITTGAKISYWQDGVKSGESNVKVVTAGNGC